MTNKILFILTCFFTLTNCNVNEDLPEQEAQNYRTEWHLLNVSGGVAGVNDDFEANTIIWIFDQENNSVNITNNNTDDTKQDGFDTGTYSFSSLESNDSFYMVINGDELGEYTFPNQQTLQIDENYKSDSDGTDGFIYTFGLVLVLEE